MEERNVSALPDTETVAVSEKAETDAKPAKKKKEGGFVLLLTQSLVAIVLVLFGLLFRLIGGGAFDQLRTQLSKALMDNTLVEAVLFLWIPPTEEQPEDASSQETTTTQTKATAAGTAPAASVYLPLVSGTLTSGYGMREDPLSQITLFHKGWDIAATESTPIAALYSGTVTEVSDSGDYGHTLVIRYSDTAAFRYAHCSRVLVREGESVQAGETVALVGSTGKATGNHLHLEWLLNGVPRNPEILFGGCPYD